LRFLVRDDLLAELRRLCGDLAASAHEGEHGIYWDTSAIRADGSRTEDNRPGLYGGSAGIVLFSATAGRFLEDEAIIDQARRGARWLLSRGDEIAGFSLARGTSGIAFALLALYRATRERVWLDEATHLTLRALPLPETSKLDYLNGGAGVLLLLCHLYAAGEDPRLLTEIEGLIEPFLTRARPGPTGLYWDRSKNNDHALCGMAHGGAGIAFALLECGVFFHNDGLVALAEEALAFESSFFDTGKGNWRDNRERLTSPDVLATYKRAIAAGEPLPVSRALDTVAWCNGAPGIGLVKLSAWQHLRNRRYLADVRVALETTRAHDTRLGRVRRYILCHGLGGNMDLFIEAARVLEEEALLAVAWEVAEEMVTRHRETGFYRSGFPPPNEGHPSLFMGDAGIGYFLLRLLAPDTAPSILAPALSRWWPDTVAQPGLIRDPVEMEKTLFLELMPRTMRLAESVAPEMVARHFRNRQPDFDPEHYAAFLIQEADSLPREEGALLRDVCRLERRLLTAERGITSYGTLYAREAMVMDQIAMREALDEAAFARVRLVASRRHQIVETAWSWQAGHAHRTNAGLPAGVYPVLISTTAKGVVETWLSELSVLALLVFSEPLSVRNGLERMISAFEEIPAAQRDIVEQKLLEQIQNAWSAGMLVVAPEEDQR